MLLSPINKSIIAKLQGFCKFYDKCMTRKFESKTTNDKSKTKLPKNKTKYSLTKTK